jgi:hypothetical protein
VTSFYNFYRRACRVTRRKQKIAQSFKKLPKQFPSQKRPKNLDKSLIGFETVLKLLT